MNQTAAQLREEMTEMGIDDFEIDVSFSSVPKVSFIRVVMWQWSRELEVRVSVAPHSVARVMGRDLVVVGVVEALRHPEWRVRWANEGALRADDTAFIESHREEFARLYD
jgi:hypothetical protein